MKPYIFAGNWKMNHTLRETEEYFKVFLRKLAGRDFVDREIVIAPPYTSLALTSSLIKDTPVKLASQNAHFATNGAFTGEISPVMLKELGVEYVILGHSERRHLFKEDDELIGKRLEGVYKEGLIPILCVGETLSEREAGHTLSVVERQVKRGLERLTEISSEKVVIAYEPVWAIGTGVNATPEQAEEVHSFIRKTLSTLYGKDGEAIRILYGGSVTPDNVASLMSKPNVEGVLVGGASLDPEKFFKIVEVKIEKETLTECALPDYSNLDPSILEIPKNYKRLLIVGASPKPNRPSNIVMDYLLKAGYEVIPINPAYEEILGVKTLPNLESVPLEFKPEVVIIFRRSSEVLPVVEKALKLKPKVIWMQEGIVNNDAKTLAEAYGVKVVMNLCFKKVHQLTKWK
ncbi:MAG: triose-phosphate isomerase [Caldimicrobium sp.]|nr:triose-phosphate isomerase [Caldimicrobium sp.]MDW8183489.1 triose-phosphate isomerase [Caldimicrobium sp.]